MRQYYGPLLGHRTDFIRNFAAQTFSIILRKLSTKAFKTHSKRLFRAIGTNLSTQESMSLESAVSSMAIYPMECSIDVVTSVDALAPAGQALQVPSRVKHVLTGISQLLFTTFKGVRGCLHSKGGKLLTAPLALLVPMQEQIIDDIISSLSKKTKSKKTTTALLPEKCQKAISSFTHVDVMVAYSTGHIVTNAVRKLFRHLHPTNLAELWLRVMTPVTLVVKFWTACELLNDMSIELLMCLEISSLNLVELLIFSLSHSNGRGLSCEDVRESICTQIIPTIFDMCDKCFKQLHGSAGEGISFVSTLLFERSRVLLCHLWKTFPRHPMVLNRLTKSVDLALSLPNSPSGASFRQSGVLVLTRELFPILDNDLIKRFLVKPVLHSISCIKDKIDSATSGGFDNDEHSTWLCLLLQVQLKLMDNRTVIEFQEGNLRQFKKEWQKPNEWDLPSESESDDGQLSDPDSTKIMRSSKSKVSSSVEVLFSCANELDNLIDGCFDVVTVNIDSDILSSSEWKNNAILALSCLTWIAEVHPDPLLKNDSNMKKAAKFLTKCRASLFNMFCETVTSEIASIGLLFTKFLGLFCALDALTMDSDSKKSEDSTYLISELLPSLVKVVSRSSKSIGNVWRLLCLLEHISPDPSSSEFSGLFAGGLLNEEQEDLLLKSLTISVLTPSYWLRVCALKVLCYITPPTIVIKTESHDVGKQKVDVGDHEANMDDEDMMMVQEQRTQVIDVCNICLEAATLPAALSTEREFSRRLGQLEVLVRAGRLEAKYIKLICSFCLGMLYYKFMPLWEPCVGLIVAIVNSSGGDEVVWPLILNSIEVLSLKSLDEADSSTLPQTDSDLLNYFHYIEDRDDGENMIAMEVSSSPVFMFKVKWYHSRKYKIVLPDDRADTATVFNSVWDVFRKSPVITLRHSKVVVPMFFRFLKEQYYETFTEDPDIPVLQNNGVLSTTMVVGDSAHVKYPRLPNDIVRKRLTLFLEVFAAVTSPKQLFQHQLLWKYYVAIISKPETNVVKLALTCMLAYKAPFLNPYKESLLKLLADSTFRDEMLVFNISPTDGVVLREHRVDFIPLLSRIVYGRFSSSSKGSKSEKEQSIARRHAILTFLGLLPGEEMEMFLHLMIRGIIPKENMMAIASLDNDSSNSNSWNIVVENMLLALSPEFMLTVPFERQIGFLHVIGYAIKICGFNFTSYVHILNKLLSSMLVSSQIHAQSKKSLPRLVGNNTSDSDNIEVDEEDGTGNNDDEILDVDDDVDDDDLCDPEVHSAQTSTTSLNLSQVARIRTMSLQRLCEIVHQYQEFVDFSSTMEVIWSSLGPLFAAIPGSINGSITAKAPALLKLLHSLVQYERTIAIVATREDIVKIVIQCVAANRVSQSIVTMVMEIIAALLTYRDGSVVLNHSQLIINCFSRRFLGPHYDINIVAEVKLSELKISPSGSVREELKLLSSIATNFFSKETVKVDSQSISNLSVLLLGMIRTYTTTRKIRVEESWIVSILKTYGSLLWRVKDVRGHVGFLSRLFGPASHSLSLFNNSNVRQDLVEVYKHLAIHPSTEGLLTPSCQAIEKLVAMDPKVIDSRDFTQCMPVFQALAGSSVSCSSDFDYSWNALLGPDHCKSTRNSSMCSVVIFECIRSMYDSEIVIRSAAVAALKRFVELSGVWGGILPLGDIDVSPQDAWLESLKSVFVPGIRRGLKMSSDQVKKGFVSLQSHVIRTLGIHCLDHAEYSQLFHSDLLALMHEDVEQDFFENIFHIQLHRRGKAMNKLRTILVSEQESRINPTSFIHVLLPLALHPLSCEEFKKKDHMALLQDATSLLSAIAAHLPWNQYYSLIRTVLKMLDNDRCDKEKVLLTALCGVLDSFHFDMSTPDVQTDGGHVHEEAEDEDEDDDKLVPNDDEKVVEAVNNRIAHKVVQSIMPWVKVYLLKEGTDHKGNKTKTVRTLVALALTKLLKRLEPPVISREKKNTIFLNLVMNIVTTLKCKDSSARDAARESLSKMVLTMGMDSLKVVLYEFNHTLASGYQRHVRNYSVRSLLTSVLEEYVPDSTAFSIPVLTSGDNDLVSQYARKVTISEFDKCIPLVVDFCMDDINGIANEDRETKDDVKRTLIREAKGNKANEILELCGKSLLFRPTYALLPFPKSEIPQNLSVPVPSTCSSLHSLVTPLLNVLSSPDEEITSSIIGRISEALQRIALGLSKNPTFLASELLLYLHATLHPFVARIVKDISTHRAELGRLGDEVPESDELEASIPSYLRDDSSDEEEAALYSKKHKKDNEVSKLKPKTWLPMDRRSMQDQRAVVEQRNAENRALIAIQDGASAPKLTGRNSHKNKESKKRSKSDKSARIESDQAFAASVKFCLTLLLSSLKQNRMDSSDEEIRSMATPFLPLLGQCLRLSQNSGIVLLAMRCICSLLSWGIPVEPSFSRAVGKRMLSMMYQGGAVLSTDNDLVQTCIKGLTSLFFMYNRSTSAKSIEGAKSVGDSEPMDVMCVVNGSEKDADLELKTNMTTVAKEKIPLDETSIRTLLSLLTSSILEITSTYQNSAFQLIRMIIDAKVLVPEMYDLIECLIEQIVLSHRKGVREAASSNVMQFMFTYPLGKKRMTSHIKQFIQNCSYEYEDGRCAALMLMIDVCRQLPVPVLDDFAQLIFLPMSLQVINDTSGKCRSTASDVVVALMRRCSPEKVSMCLKYSLQWIGIGDIPTGNTNNSNTPRTKGKGRRSSVEAETMSSQSQEAMKNIEIKPLIRTGAQVLGLIIAGRPDVVKKSKTISNVVYTMRALLHRLLSLNNDGTDGGRRQSLQKRELSVAGQQEGEGDVGAVTTWSILYHTLLLTEKIFTHLPQDIDSAILSHQAEDDLPLFMETVQESMLYPHSWVRSVSCRILSLYIKRRNPLTLESSVQRGQSEILTQHNQLYNFARRLCVTLNQPVLTSNLLDSLSNCLVFVVRALFHSSSGEEKSTTAVTGGDDDIDSDGEGDGGNAHAREGRAGANWVIQRLRGIGADSRGYRRFNVIKVFAALVTVEENESMLSPHLEQLIEVCIRSRISRAVNEETEMTSAAIQNQKDTKEAAGELLEAIEQRVGSSTFIGIYGEVQRRIESSKAEKKRRLAAEAVSDPASYAQRKAKHAEKKKESRKRKNERFAAVKGIKKKKQSTNSAIIYEE